MPKPKATPVPSTSTTGAPVTRSVARAYISAPVRRDLWIAAAGRCEFRGCCKPVDRDFLTKKAKSVVGEFAHIIADSPAGARGVPGLSEKLAADPSNLMLACFDCHSRIDRHGQSNEFTAEQLRAMKRDHEARIEFMYSATGVEDSMPVVMSFPVGAHVPVIDVRHIQHAMLTNSGFKRFPTAGSVHIDQSNFFLQDNEPDFWGNAQRALTQQYEQRILPELVARKGAVHLTIAGFAPIPMLMKLGALVGDKTPAAVMDLPNEKWLWDTRDACPEPSYTFTVPPTLPREISVVVSISGRAQHPLVATSSSFMPLRLTAASSARSPMCSSSARASTPSCSSCLPPALGSCTCIRRRRCQRASRSVGPCCPRRSKRFISGSGRHLSGSRL